MSVCISCLVWSSNGLCPRCEAQLRPAAATTVGELRVVSGYEHETVARRLVHLFKYQCINRAGVVLAEAMAAALSSRTTALVPVPRALARRVRYGNDPAAMLAKLVGNEVGLPVINGLWAQLWWPAHAGTARSARRPPRFGLQREVPVGAVLVDDVLTTGATLQAAARIHGIKDAVTATRAGSDGYG